MRAILSAALGLFIVAIASVLWAAEDAALAEARLAEVVKALASDEMEGRGASTRGLDLAADYIAAKFVELELKTDLYEGMPFQKFSLGTDVKLGPKKKNRLVIVGPPEKEGGKPRRFELKLDADFTSMAVGGSGNFDLPLIFAGYGITAGQIGYDDYQDVDVRGKAVLILSKEPEQNNPKSKFDGKKSSQHATFQNKVANAAQHGVGAVILVNDHFDLNRRQAGERTARQKNADKLAKTKKQFKEIADPTPEQCAAHKAEVDKLTADIKRRDENLARGFDKLAGVMGGGRDSKGKLPVLFATRATFAPIVTASLNTDLATLEAQIDEGPSPKSCDLTSWRVVGETNVVRQEIAVKNVVAVLPGEGPLADETVVVGAHYDHLGYRGGSDEAIKPEDIYNGADDNASGVAVLIEVARRLTARKRKLPRRVVLIAFSGEERGLHGSRHYIAHPLFPLKTTVAMMNLDMVGRLRDDTLYPMGIATAAEFESWVDTANENCGFVLGNKPSGYGTSDHAPFYKAKIPILHFITGGHPDMHRTTDDFDKIHVPGMRRVAELATDVVTRIAEADKRPQYQQANPRAGKRPFFGTVSGTDTDGYVVTSVIADSPAHKAGVKNGDVIVKFGGSKIAGLKDFLGVLDKYKAGDKVECVVRRGDKELTLTVTLTLPK